MCKEGWYVGLGQEGIYVRVGELSEIPQKRVEQKKGEGKKSKKGGKLGKGVGALKEENPLTNYVIGTLVLKKFNL